MEKRVYYPIGQQNFKRLIEADCIYVDKTRYIDRILASRGRYFFLARPRRFGKSLFLSTLEYFFKGERDLFRGLHADTIDWQWEEYPVLRLDLNTDRYDEPGMLEITLESRLREWERKYGVENLAGSLPARFSDIIAAAHHTTGKQVVILVDEYDKPLVGNLNRSGNFEHYRSRLAGLYSCFKSSAEHIRLVFLTGVSRFSKLSVFSDLNNIKDISFSDDYADICGITEQELYDNFQQGISLIADNLGISYEQACLNLKKNYDGYRFAAKGSDIYNPWSLLNAMADKTIANYWNDTGIPTIMAEALKKVNANLRKTFDKYVEVARLKGLDLLNPDPTALLYQTGYLTIKEYDRDLDMYRLGIPNREVKKGLFDVLLPYCSQCITESANSILSEIVVSLKLGRPAEFMDLMASFFSGIPYSLRMENENNFQNAFYLLLSLIGLETEAEEQTSDGRIDITIRTPKYIYIIELKYDGSADDALDQIERKKYARKYLPDSRRIFSIGAAFSTKTRTIEDYRILDQQEPSSPRQ